MDSGHGASKDSLGGEGMSRLTKAEKSALVDVLNERIAGGTEDLRDALGLI